MSNNLSQYLEAFNSEAFRQAAERDLDGVILAIVQAALADHDIELPKDDKDWLEALADADFMLGLLQEVSPGHAAVARSFPAWYRKQVEQVRQGGMV